MYMESVVSTWYDQRLIDELMKHKFGCQLVLTRMTSVTLQKYVDACNYSAHESFSPDGSHRYESLRDTAAEETETGIRKTSPLDSGSGLLDEERLHRAQRDRLKLKKFCSGVNKKLGLYLHQARPKDWKTAIEVAQDYEQWTSLDEEDPVKRLNSVARNLEKAVSTFQEHAANFVTHQHATSRLHNHHCDEENPYNDHDDGETFYNGYYEGQDFDTDYYDGALYLYNHNYDREAIDNDYDDEAFY
ncbi:hypothetical protein QR680_019417 [Steinernema hermaphroditum]|uniref:Uncharacterized protein n=1 Tax=Steinernema hermaphroditum TaxID=289476 RepID=A0AA39GPL1_9BILA|nr:hypothetical protein QR680_019417 [Steinernema hermaphroditum]